MKISELKKLLEEYQNKHGDIEVYLYSLYSGDYFETNKGDFVTSEEIEGEKDEPEYLAILS
jgi:hypothetical protein